MRPYVLHQEEFKISKIFDRDRGELLHEKNNLILNTAIHFFLKGPKCEIFVFLFFYTIKPNRGAT